MQRVEFYHKFMNPDGSLRSDLSIDELAAEWPALEKATEDEVSEAKKLSTSLLDDMPEEVREMMGDALKEVTAHVDDLGNADQLLAGAAADLRERIGRFGGNVDDKAVIGAMLTLAETLHPIACPLSEIMFRYCIMLAAHRNDPDDTTLAAIEGDLADIDISNLFPN